MRKLSFMFAAATLLAGCKGSQESPLTGSLLWEVSGNGLTTTSYVIGTNRNVDASYYYYIPGFQNALDNVSGVVVERDLTNLPPELVELAGKKVRLPEGITYRDILSEEDYAFIDNEVAELTGLGGLDAKLFEPGEYGTRPNTMGALIPEVLLAEIMWATYCTLPIIEGGAVERMPDYMLTLARNLDKNLYSLLDARNHIETSYLADLNEQVSVLMTGARDREKNRIWLKAIYDAYMEADLDGLVRLRKELDIARPERAYADRIAAENAEWLPEIEAMMRNEPMLVVLSASNLGGETGMLMLLRRQGYTVKAVKQ